MSYRSKPTRCLALCDAPSESQPTARLRSAVIEGWVASRYETIPDRALALRCWLDQLLAPRSLPHLFTASHGSSAADLIAAAIRLQRLQPLAALHPITAGQRLSFPSSRILIPHSPSQLQSPNPSPLDRPRNSDRPDPDADQFTLDTAHRLVVLWLRKSSQLAHRLITSLEHDPHHPTMIIPDDERLVPSSWQRRLIQLNARVIPLQTPHSISMANSPPSPTSPLPIATDRQTRGLKTPSRWLIHMTRASDRRRAGESRVDFFSRLLALPTDQIGGPFITLRTILQQALLRGRSEPIREKVRVVSWSATPLPILLANRRFRPGRRHWDYEPYGIAVPQELASHLGASPVIYGSPEHFAQLLPEQRPFFQPITSQASRESASGQSIDWSFEQEWRSIGDVRLVGPIAKQAIAFVPTQAEATSLQGLSPLRVIALDSPQAAPLLALDHH